MINNITIYMLSFFLFFLTSETIIAQGLDINKPQGMSSWVFIVMLVIFVVVFTVNNKNKKGNHYIKTFGAANENGGFENFVKGKGIFKIDDDLYKTGGNGSSGTW